MKNINFVSSRLVRDAAFEYAPKIGDKEDVVQCIKDLFSDWDREIVGVMNLSVKGKVLNVSIVSVGCLNGSLVHPREVFKSAILSSANSLIMFHTHPSGSKNPSKEDFETTEKIAKAGRILGIQLIDHVIITHDETFSFLEMGLLHV